VHDRLAFHDNGRESTEGKKNMMDDANIDALDGDG
jgi:hypothetical protein